MSLRINDDDDDEIVVLRQKEMFGLAPHILVGSNSRMHVDCMSCEAMQAHYT